MRALVVDRPGDDVRPRIAERPVPNPGPGQVLIEVAYVAVNWSDIQKRQGIYPDRVDYPVVLGAEVSGRVVAAGAGVPRRHLGRQTAALCGPRLVGGGADFVAVPLEYLVPLPRGVDLLAATALPLATLTAYHLLHTAHRVRKAEVVLVHAAAGSVGLATVQTARLRGATVIGTVGSAAKVDAPRRFGAALVIDRSREEFVETAMAFTGDRGVDLVIDSLGGEILPRSFDCLRRYGHLINIGEASGEPDFPVRKKLYERSTSMAGFELLHAEPGSSRWKRGLRWVASRVAAGQLTVPVAGTIPLDQAGRAHEALESRGTIGKLMLEVNAGHAGWA